MPNDNKAAWRLTDKGWLYIVGDAQRAGAGLLTLLVDDVDEWIADLARRGLAPDAIETIPGAVREAVNVDPDGNRITVGRPLGAGG
ncbi:MAG: VOC family protein [Actinobacteria bacterium]|nr:MAG: VOC family protein [Actinomycetota bacterium]